ncbi:hypothetical protein [Thiocystis violascens]|uniref:Uncharacterized protein n=1 Tax=Thiocystis violascens (strain ATCC 17096 / DSM 198 / 6111) TaxID=765911 RepID=I3Y973_THIV6|nr:hypothetical protein [Thiocystis violascens]AFL73541.1 hypothetical protein Thivi_1550 [Thiocystis violascens DSM 198]
MSLNDVLLSLLEPVGTAGGIHFVTWDMAQQWPEHALDSLLRTGVLVPAKPAESVECRICVEHCDLDVHPVPGRDGDPSRIFAICEDPDMQDQIGPILIPPERLRQWKVAPLQLARVVADLLAVDSQIEDRHGQTDIRIGMLKGRKGRRWLSLNKSPLTLEVNGHQVSLAELLFFEDEALMIDRERIDQLLDTVPSSPGKAYRPSTEKRETRKRASEAMYEDWRDAYRKLRRQHPSSASHPDTWISQRIAKLPIAQGRDPETIRKNMKP